MGDLVADFLTFQPKLLAIYIYNVYLCSILTLIFTTMAIVKNFWLKGSKKRLGGAVLYSAMGQTRARELANSVSNPRTEAQMSQRIKWANLVNFYRANASWMKYAFETKKANQSEYNKFMSVNVTASRIALTKDMAAAGAVIAYPYTLTQGSLPSVEWNNTQNTAKSNIFIAPDNTMEDYNTVGEFSRDLIQYNGALREGDQLSLIRVTQMTNNATGYPYIIVRKYEVILDSTSNVALSNYIPVDFFSAEGTDENNTLNVPKTNRQGGFALIISRTIGGKTYVSTQALVIVNNEVLISQFSNNAAIQAAIASYGESEDAFLSSTSAGAITSQPVGLALTYAQFPDGILTAGSETPTWREVQQEAIGIYFNDTIPGGVQVSAKVVFTDGTERNAESPVIENNFVSVTIPTAPTGDNSPHILSITVTLAGVDYTIRFASANAYTIEGLE